MTVTDPIGRRSWIGRVLMLFPLAFFVPRLALGSAAQRERKLPLEDKPFTTRFAAMRDPAQFAREMRSAQRDLLGYLGEHFELTAAQRRAVAAFPKASVEALNTALDLAIRENRTLILRGAKDGCRDIRTMVEGKTLVVQILG